MIKKVSFGLIVLMFSVVINTLQAQELREFIDMQMHPTMHVPYNFFGDGFEFIDEANPPHLTHLHQFKNVNYADYWKDNKGARIIVAGSLTSEWVATPKKAKEVILKQINYVNDFAKRHSDHFVVAKSPQEIRDYVHNTDKTVIVHSIEGAKRLINSLEDAQFWADQGVAFITLMHLVDSEYGSAAIRPGMMTTLLNFKGAVKAKKRRGLKDKGKQAILWLAQAGIMTDLTHMESHTRQEALAFMREKGIPPISTHDCPKSMKNTARGISNEEIIDLYQLGGFMALPISGVEMELVKADAVYVEREDSLVKTGTFCRGSVDSYSFMYEQLNEYIMANTGVILGDTSIAFNDLTEAQKVDLAIGFQSDFNGWLNHSRPRVGKKGSIPMDSTQTYEAIETEGLKHPGLLASQWRYLEKKGVDLLPIKRSSERFVQLWEYFIENKENWK